MAIEDGLVALLSADSGVSALVGNRIHPLVLPRKPTYPALVYQRVSGERVRSLSGPSGRVRPRVQIDAYAELKWEEVERFEMTPHPVEYDMYFSV